MNSSYKISISGLNLHHIIDYFQSRNIHLSNISRENNKKMYCTISKTDYLKLKKSPIFKNYKFKIIKRYGFENFYRTMLSKIGLFTSVIIMLLTTMNITSNIQKIYLNTENHICQNQENCIFHQENKEKLSLELSYLGIKNGEKIKNIKSNSQIKQTLMFKFPQISDVSVKQKGVYVYVDILEAKLPVTSSHQNLIASESGIVVNTNVTSGKLKVKIGDVVLKGETLIEKELNPICGSVTLRTFYHKNLIFNEQQTTYVKTGKKINFNSLSFFNISLNVKKKIPFTIYESEVKNKYVSVNSLLPVKLKQTTFYELKKIEQKIPFETKQEELKLNLKEETLKLLPPNAEIKNTTFTVKQEDSRYLITCYIETFLTLKI